MNSRHPVQQRYHCNSSLCFYISIMIPWHQCLYRCPLVKRWKFLSRHFVVFQGKCPTFSKRPNMTFFQIANPFCLKIFWNTKYTCYPPISAQILMWMREYLSAFAHACFRLAYQFLKQSFHVKSPNGPMRDTTNFLETQNIGWLHKGKTILKISASFFTWFKNY